MSFSWSALHAQLLKSTQHMSFEIQYRRIREEHTGELPPGDVTALLGFLHDPGNLPEPKNAALRALVQAGQDNRAALECTSTIVLLALWPGLDAVRSRLRRAFPLSDDTLDAELIGRLTVAISDCDLGCVNRLAATLLRNVERDTTRALIRADREVTTARPLDECIDSGWCATAFMSSVAQDEAEVSAVSGHLRDLLGDDVHLVLLVLVGGCTQREAGALLGLSHEAARKRFQRAITRLKKHGPDCPNPARGLAFDSHRKSHRKANR